MKKVSTGDPAFGLGRVEAGMVVHTAHMMIPYPIAQHRQSHRSYGINGLQSLQHNLRQNDLAVVDWTA